MVNVNFYSAGGNSSGVEISGLGLGAFSYVGFFGSSGVGDQIEIGDANDYTWICNSGGVGISGEVPAQGQMMNNKWVDSSGVSVSGGTRVNLSTITASGSGTLLIRVTDTADLYIQNAKLRAYDGTSVSNGPSGIWVLSYEIIPVGQSGTGDTTWAVIDQTNYNFFVDRTTTVGYPAQLSRDYTVGLSVRPKATATSGIKNFGFYFSCEVI